MPWNWLQLAQKEMKKRREGVYPGIQKRENIIKEMKFLQIPSQEMQQPGRYPERVGDVQPGPDKKAVTETVLGC